MNILDFLRSNLTTKSPKYLHFSFLDKRINRNGIEFKEAVKAAIPFHISKLDEEYAEIGIGELYRRVEESCDDFLEEIKPKKVKKYLDIPEDYINSDDYIVVINIEEKKELDRYVVLTKDFRPTTMTFGSWATKVDPEVVKGIKNGAPWVKLTFNPQRPEALYREKFDSDERIITVINNYRPPKHRLMKIDNPEPPKILMKFLRNLFLTEDCFNYMMESIWYVLEERLQVYIVMNGRTGIGKGLFTDSIVMNLVGRENAVVAPASWDKSMFNAWMLNKQVVTLDEVKVMTEGVNENINYLKRMNNDVQNIERKGLDADKTSKNYASFFITSNHGTKNFKLEEDNRRFAPVDLTTTKFVDTYTKKEQEEILYHINDEDSIAHLYWYIKQNHNPHITSPDRTPLTLLYGNALYKSRYESLRMWQKVLVDSIISGEKTEYTRSYIKQKFHEFALERTGNKSRFSVQNDQIETFLSDYRHYEDEYPMGTIDFDDENELKVVCNTKYISKKAKDNKDFGFGDIL